MNGLTSTTATTTAICWNGPICPTCGARYHGSHACSQADILRRVQELLALIDQLPAATTAYPEDRTRGCPCRPENGGSGVCGCILSGPRITC